MKAIAAILTAVFSALLCLLAGLGIVRFLHLPRAQYIAVD